LELLAMPLTNEPGMAQSAMLAVFAAWSIDTAKSQNRCVGHLV
jgi:hypothetical protein